MNEARDELLDELTKLVNVDLAPDFQGRVQRAVEQRGARRLWWPWAAAGVSAVVVLLLVAAGEQRGRDEQAPATVSAAKAAPVSVSQPATEAVGPPPRMARAVVRRAAARAAKPEVLVPPGSAQAFALLVWAARRGEVPSSLWRNDGSDVPAAIAVPPIEIPPSEIPLAVQVSGVEGS